MPRPVFTQLTLIGASLFAGLAGARLGLPPQIVSAAGPETLRASRFELVDNRGNPVAVLSSSGRGEASLSFGGSSSTGNVLSIGVSDGKPSINLLGKDGVKRCVMYLNSNDEPVLGMGDASWEGRVILGAFAQDTSATPAGTWGLSVGAPGIHHPLASVTAAREVRTGKFSGSVAIVDSQGQRASLR